MECMKERERQGVNTEEKKRGGGLILQLRGDRISNIGQDDGKYSAVKRNDKILLCGETRKSPLSRLGQSV